MRPIPAKSNYKEYEAHYVTDNRTDFLQIHHNYIF